MAAAVLAAAARRTLQRAGAFRPHEASSVRGMRSAAAWPRASEAHSLGAAHVSLCAQNVWSRPVLMRGTLVRQQRGLAAAKKKSGAGPAVAPPAEAPVTPKEPFSKDAPRHEWALLRFLAMSGILGCATWLIIDSARQDRKKEWAAGEAGGDPRPGPGTRGPGFESGAASPRFAWTAALENGFETVSDYVHDFIDRVGGGASAAEPLLPDAKDLKYPDGLPTLVVDLDKVILKMDHDRRKGWQVLRRPGADEFFKELVYHYEIAVWSDDNFPVAQDVCTKWQLPVVGAIHRDQCKRRRGKYVKDLRRLGRDLSRVIIVDHDPAAVAEQPENALLVSEFDGDPADRELFALAKFLKMAALSETRDLRQLLRKYGEPGARTIVQRWAVENAEQEKASEVRRALGSRLFGGGGLAPPQAPFGAGAGISGGSGGNFTTHW